MEGPFGRLAVRWESLEPIEGSIPERGDDSVVSGEALIPSDDSFDGGGVRVSCEGTTSGCLTPAGEVTVLDRDDDDGFDVFFNPKMLVALLAVLEGDESLLLVEEVILPLEE